MRESFFVRENDSFFLKGFVEFVCIRAKECFHAFNTKILNNYVGNILVSFIYSCQIL